MAVDHAMIRQLTRISRRTGFSVATGIKALPGRYRHPLPPCWEVLRAQLPSHESKYKLSRFMGFCAQKGMDPAAVAQNTFEAFHTALDEESFSRDPGAAYRDACLTWNTAASTIPCWLPLQVEVPNRRHDALTVEAFPASFGADVEAYLGRRAQPDVFAKDYSRPLRRRA